MHPRSNPNAIPLWGKWLIATLLGSIILAIILTSPQLPQLIQSGQALYQVIYGLVIIAIIGGLYITPTLIARKTPRFAAILVLNLALGWTVLGWLAALIWALAEAGSLNKKSVP